MKYNLGDLTIDTGRQLVSRGAEPIPLPKLSYDLLLALLRTAPNVVSLDELMRLVWPGIVVSPETVSQRVKLLRDALNDDPRAPRYIGGLRGRGYQIVAAVTEVGDMPAVPKAPSNPAATGALLTPPIAGRHGIEQTMGAIDPTHVSQGETDPIPESRPHVLGEIQRTEEAAARGLPPERSEVLQSGFSRAVKAWIAASAVLVAGLSSVGLLVWHTRDSNKAATPGIASGRVMLAVLPFQNLSNDPEQEYLSDGLTEETIADLGELSPERLGVIARTSAMVYKHSNKTVAEIGRELNVDYLLEGSVRRDRQTVRVTAQLIRVNDQSHLWSHNYDRELAGLLALQNELSRAIAQQVRVNLAPNYASQSATKYVPNTEAYELYLQGLFYLNKRTDDAIKKSIEYFRQSTEKDPGFALAYASLASAHLAYTVFSPSDSFPNAAAAAARALELDDGLAEAHAVLGAEKAAFEFEGPAAEEQIKRAIVLNPNSAYAHFIFSLYYLTPRGESNEAIVEMKKVLALDPLSPLYNTILAFTYYFARDYDLSLAQYRSTLHRYPEFFIAHAQLAWLYAEREDYPNAIMEITKARLLQGESAQTIAADELVLKKSFEDRGREGFWQAMRATKMTGLVFFLPQVYARLGDADMAIDTLQRSYERRVFFVNFIKVDPAYDSLRSDPRFVNLVHRMGLAP
jgi:TolB-like protein/DNA-binding winged helix-turn-helix (wHTH) protein